MEKTKGYAALQNKEFRAFLSIRLLATIAFAVQFLIIEWKVWEVTQQAKYLAFVPLFEIIALIPFALLYSGRIIDQSEKKLSLAICLLSCILIALSISYFLSEDFIQSHAQSTFLACVYSTMFVWGIVRSFYSPAAFSLYALILPKKLYANGATWNSSMWQIGAVLGPAIGGVLYALFEAQNSLYIVVTLFIICFGILMLSISSKEIKRPKEEGSRLQLAMAGVSFIFQNKVIFGAVFLDMIAVLFGGAVALIPIFIDKVIDLDSFYDGILAMAQALSYPLDYENPKELTQQVKSIGLGVLRSAPAIGAIMSMIAVAFFPVQRHTGKVLLGCILAFGMSIIGFGLSELFWLSFAMLLFSGIFDGVSVVIRGTILQLLTPDDMKGRVSSANSIFVGSSNEFGAFESGITAQWLGAAKAAVLGGCITVGIVGLGYFNLKALRDFELEEVELDEK